MNRNVEAWRAGYADALFFRPCETAHRFEWYARNYLAGYLEGLAKREKPENAPS